MIPIDDDTTLGEALFRAADAYGEASLLAVPANAPRDWLPEGRELSYAVVADAVRRQARLSAR